MEGTRAAGRRPFMPASRILEGSLPERHPKGPDLFWRPTTTQNGVRAGYQGRSPCLVRSFLPEPLPERLLEPLPAVWTFQEGKNWENAKIFFGRNFLLVSKG